MRSLPWVALSGLGLAGLSSGLHMPVQRVRPRSSGSTPMSKTSGGKGLENTQNILYTAEVKVGDKSYTLQLDTGSSDLWFAPDKSYNQTFANAKIYEDLQVNLTYGTGWAAGAVAQIDVEFAGFSVKNQSFLFIEEISEWDVKFEEEYPIYQGIAGLSFDTLSQVNNIVEQSANSTWGRSLMSNIFLSDPSTPNHIAFFLDRTGDLNDTDTGYFDIGTYAAGYEGVANMPKLDVFTVYENGVGRWNVLVHGLSINGKDQTLKTTIKADKSAGIVNIPPSGSVAALMDTGTSAAEIPEEAFHALYKGMGGVLIKEIGQYAVPCTAEADVTFAIGNQTVSVHPLDLTNIQVFSDGNGQNLTVCLSAYELATSGGGELDIILGDAFLRNVYAVYDFGDFVNTESGFSTKSPFIQILPLTDAKSASAEFKQARAKALAALPPQVDISTINDPTPKPMNATSSGSGSGSGSGSAAKIGAGTSNLASSTGSDDDSEAVASLKKLATLAPIALGLLGLSVALLIVLVVISGLALARFKKQATPLRTAAYVPVPLERERAGEYKDEHGKYDTQFRD